MALEPHTQACLVCVNLGYVSAGWEIFDREICWKVAFQTFLLTKGTVINLPSLITALYMDDFLTKA